MQPSFEESLARLEKIVEQLETGENSLAESLQLFEEGIKLVRLCNERLAAAELRIRQLTEMPDGTVSAVPFAVTPELGVQNREASTSSKDGGGEGVDE